MSELGSTAEARDRPEGRSLAITVGLARSGALSLRRTLTGVLAYTLASVVFAGFAVAVELVLGHSLAAGRGGDAARSLEDAAWHLGTGFALALPTRRRVLLVVMPLMTLGIDADHLFGGLLPTVVGRESHGLLFLVLVSVGLALSLGPDLGLLAASATLLHLGVDGGGFPLLAPASTALWPLPILAAIGAIVAAAALLGLVGRRPIELLRPGYLVPAALSVAATLAVGSLIPWVQLFNGA